ncbi:MAG TPA: thioredoxin family protein [Candidatus Eisenbacteria bacterium]|nr:thioredoxin family protein [Candidatus Eisenbacteria bacterium]
MENKATADAALIAAWQKKLPATSSEARAWWDKTSTEDTRTLIIEWSGQGKGSEDFFPYASQDFEVQPVTERLETKAPGTLRISKQVKKLEGQWPNQLAGLLVNKPEADQPLKAWEVKLAISGSVPSQASASTSALKPSGSLWAMLGLAFLGGLILNIMPCVLPVIALKILGFVNQSRQSPAHVRKLGVIYALGVLFSFLVLAGLVIAVQHAGRDASWGMQFQNAQFRVVITILVTLVALNLFGLFEISLGGRAMGAAGELAAKEGASGAFFNGVLATALATPCTAPFLGVALGFAFAQPSAIVVLMFLTVGLGLAAPYVILSWHPAWLKFLPKPGVWMEKFKIAMGFPMIATAIWLFTLAAPRFGRNGAFWLGMFLVLLAMAAWIWGEFVQRGARRKFLAVCISTLLLAFSYGYVLEGQLHWRSPEKISSATTSLRDSPEGIDWQPWSLAAVEKARSEGRPVFVDFTADWCVTCQANKKTSIEIPRVRAKLKEINAVALLADYTEEDDRITAELKKFGRAGVPLVLVYPKDPKSPAIVLPAVLTPGIVLDALSKAAGD